MDTIGKLLINKDFSDCWTKYRDGKIEYFDKAPFLLTPKKYPLILVVYMNSIYKKNILIHAIKKGAKKKFAFIRFVADDPLKLKNCKNVVHYTYVLKLDKPIDQIYSSFKKSTKRRIQKAEFYKLKCKIAKSNLQFDEWWYENYLKWINKKKFTKERYDL